MEVVVHNRSLKLETDYVVSGAYKNNNGIYDTGFGTNGLGNWDKLADEWISVVDQDDYSIDVDFEFSVTISQVDLKIAKVLNKNLFYLFRTLAICNDT